MLQITCNGYIQKLTPFKNQYYYYTKKDLYLKEAYHSTPNPHLVNSLAKQEHHNSQTTTREGGQQLSAINKGKCQSASGKMPSD